jgi:hypothetical protein
MPLVGTIPLAVRKSARVSKISTGRWDEGTLGYMTVRDGETSHWAVIVDDLYVIHLTRLSRTVSGQEFRWESIEGAPARKTDEYNLERQWSYSDLVAIVNKLVLQHHETCQHFVKAFYAELNLTCSTGREIMNKKLEGVAEATLGFGLAITCAAFGPPGWIIGLVIGAAVTVHGSARVLDQVP